MSTPFDFETSWKMAQVLAKSPLVGRDYQNRPESILLVAMSGSSFGWNMAESMRQMQIISGSVGVRPEAALGLCRAAGHSITGEVVDGVATVHGKRADNADEMTVTFSRADAKAAGLAGRGAWKTYESAMLWTRAVSKLCRMLFPDVGVSYTPEEIGGDAEAMLNADGPQIDVVAGSVSVADAKSYAVERYTADGFERSECISYAQAAWQRAELPGKGEAVSISPEQMLSLDAAIDADLHPEVPEPEVQYESSPVEAASGAGAVGVVVD